MRKLMILGAGIYQVPLILQAKKMGLYTVAVSRPGNYPGFAIADKIYELDTTDCEKVLAAAIRENIRGICTAGTDVAVKTVGYVCTRMGLSGLSEAAAEIVTNKAKMKEAFQKGGVSAAESQKIHTLQEAKQAAKELGFPVVIKAVDKSGSRGVIKTTVPEHLEEAYDQAMQETDLDYLLIEEFIEGVEIGVDAYVDHQEIRLLLPHDKFIYRVKGKTIPIGHQFPYPCSEKLSDEIQKQMKLAIRATGLQNCPVNADIFVNGEQAWVIEIGGRSGATCIPELISMHCGFNYYEQIIRGALGEISDFTEHSHNSCMAELLFSKKNGMITGINQEEIRALQKNGIGIQIDNPVGTRIEKFENGTNRIGHVIAPMDQKREFDKILKKIRRNIWVDEKSLEETWNE